MHQAVPADGMGVGRSARSWARPLDRAMFCGAEALPAAHLDRQADAAVRGRSPYSHPHRSTEAVEVPTCSLSRAAARHAAAQLPKFLA